MLSIANFADKLAKICSEPLYQLGESSMALIKWILKNCIFDNFDEAAKLSKASDDPYNCGG